MKLLRNLTVIAAVAGALTMNFAFKARTFRLAHEYGVHSETSTQFVLIEKLDGQTQDVDYACGSETNKTCTVTSDVNHTSFPVTVSKGAAYLPVGQGQFRTNP